MQVQRVSKWKKWKWKQPQQGNLGIREFSGGGVGESRFVVGCFVIVKVAVV